MFEFSEAKKQESTPNKTGIPDTMKENFENMSGFSFDDVKIHYNSDKPAQLNALAYTQGNQVHIAPGQEKHLGHELGHVVQQKQGRVKPTMQLQGVGVNDDERLEREADAMGKKTEVKYSRSSDKTVGNTVQMIRMLGTPATPPAPQFLNGFNLQAHHIIPNSVFQHAIEDMLQVAHNAINVEVNRFDGQWNGILLPAGAHRVGTDALGNPTLPGRPGHNAPHNQYSANVENHCVNQLANVNNDLSTLFQGQNAPTIAANLRGIIHNTLEDNLDNI